MLNFGEIKRDKYYNKSMWVACFSCGKGHWVELRKGQPRRSFDCFHCSQIRKASLGGKAQWKGGRTRDANGYIKILMPH